MVCANGLGGLSFASAVAWAAALLACSPTAKDHIREAKDAVFEKRPQEALIHYRRALDALEKDDSASAQVWRARALRGAADVYYLELRDVRRAAEVYRELIALCPDAPETLEARIYLADILRVHFRDLRGAISELTAAIARNPPQGAELSYQVAKLYFQLGDYQQCEIEAQNLVKRYETSPFVDDALFLRGQALAMLDARKHDALKAFQELVEHHPDSELKPHALVEQGRLRADLGEYEKAIELWVKALERHPDPAVVQHSIARVRRRLVATTPRAIGDEATAFDRDVRPAVARSPARTSVEAAGGTADEAASEANMGPDGASSREVRQPPEGPKGSGPSAPPGEAPPGGTSAGSHSP